MVRRLYFLLPDTGHAARVVDELLHNGVNRQHIHAIARDDIDISALPQANQRQKRDTAGRLEHLLWNGNIVTFFIALLALIVVLVTAPLIWVLPPAIIVLATFLGGLCFTICVPNVHLGEFRDAIHHGEILLMVDVPKQRVAEIEDYVHRHHPEATAGGVGWTLDALHI